MSSFVNSIINRTIVSTPLIQPRIRGKFERDTISSPTSFPENLAGSFQNDDLMAEQPDNRFEKENKVAGIIPEFKIKSNESVNQVADGHSISSYQSQSSLISQLVSKDHYSNEKPQQLTPGNLIVHKASEEYNIQKVKRHEPELPDSKVQPLVLPVKELYKLPSMLKAETDYNSLSGNTFRKGDFMKTGTDFTAEYSQANETTQTINISIGRVEVRVSQPPVQVVQAPKKEGIDIMSLNEYLDKKNHGSK